MTNAEVRSLLATAANTVDGIQCGAYYWPLAKTGSAMVRLDRVDYPNKLGGLCTWAIWVVVPSDIASAEKYLDDKGPALVEALSKELTIQNVVPATFSFDSTNVPGFSVQGIRETD